MASTIDKVKHVLHMDKSTTNTHTTGHSTTGHSGTAEGVAGPHSSRVANAADPRIDSDLDGSRNAGAHTHNTTHTGATGTGIGSHADTYNGSNTTAGPHNSNLLNKADPRVDSDRSQQYGTTGTHHTTGTGVGTTGAHHTTGTGIGTTGTTGTHHTTGTGVGTTGAYGGTSNGSTTTAGPHNSDLLNKVDPRVDSDRSQQYGTTGTHHTTGTGVGATGAYGGTHNNNTVGHTTGTHGGISNSTNAGPHNSNLANKIDPTVDSDLSGRGNNHGTSHGGILGSGTHATPGSGTAQNTAGPHNSDLLNKLDPRVDADLDGSKTFGGNKTHT